MLRQRFERLYRLPDDAPLPGALRRLAKVPEVAAARTADLVAHRVRVAIGDLVRAEDPQLARSLARRPATGPLCALVLLATVADLGVPVSAPGAMTVPGFPVSTLDDPAGPWQRAWPDADELGADRDRFRDRVAATGLLVPGAWLGAGGWPALWHRAHDRP